MREDTEEEEEKRGGEMLCGGESLLSLCPPDTESDDLGRRRVGSSRGGDALRRVSLGGEVPEDPKPPPPSLPLSFLNSESFFSF